MRKAIIIFLLGTILISYMSMSFAEDYTHEAEQLKTLNLFSGTDSGFELERAPKRVEAAAMLVNFLGKSAEANEKKYSHPFTDVPSWANNYVGYLYFNGMTTGIGNNQFGSNNKIKARDFTVFMLTSLGYSSVDFQYNQALDFAKSIKLLSTEDKIALETKEFLRGDMVHISYNALSVPTKGSQVSLKENLIKGGVISEDTLNQTDLLETYQVDIPVTSLEMMDYKDEVLSMNVKTQMANFSKVNKVGTKLQGNTEDGLYLTILISKNFKTWENQNLIIEVDLLIDDVVQYEVVMATRAFNKDTITSVGYGEAVPKMAYDTIRIRVKPIYTYSWDKNIVITKLTTEETQVAEDKISKSYAFKPVSYSKSMLESSLYSVEDLMKSIMSIENSWEQVSNGYLGAMTLILDNSYSSSYSIKFREGSGYSIGFPPNTINSEIDVQLPQHEKSYTLILLYDSNKKISEILFFQ